MEKQSERAVTRTTDENLRLSDLLVNIGQAEVEATLPTCSQATKDLYQQIEDKEGTLKRMKEAYDKLVSDNKKHEENIETLILQEKELKKALEEQEKQKVDKENEVLLVQKTLSKQNTELAEMEKLIEESKQRQAIFEAQQSKQNANLENAKHQIDEKAGEKEQLKQRLNLLIEAEDKIEDAVQADRRTIKELTSHLQNLTQSLYAKQREVDRSQLKQLESQSQVQFLHDELRNMYQNQNEIQNRFQSVFNNSNPKNIQLEEAATENHNHDPNQDQAKSQVVSLKNSISENKKKINQINSTNEDLVNQLLAILGKLHETQAKHAEVKARQKVIENQENRQEESSSSNAILAKRQHELEEVQKKLATIEREVEESKQKLKATSRKTLKKKTSTNGSIARSKLGSRPNSVVSGEHSIVGSMKSFKSMPSLPTINSEKRMDSNRVNSAKLAEMKRERNNILEQEIRKASIETSEERKKLKNEIGSLNLEIRSYESEIVHLKNELQKLNEEKASLETEVDAKNSSLVIEEKQIFEEIQQIEEAHKDKITELTSELEKARESLAEVEHGRNLLADELRQAKVDEDNLRNRYNTYQSWKLNNNSSLKKLKHSQQQLENEKLVNSDVEIELNNLNKLLILAQERNHITQQSLATLKPYYDEVAEFKTLLFQRSQLLQELNQLQKQLRSLELPKNGQPSANSENF
uniref:Uncharacterized protein n=1 Tax=Acrobeloides nanus TaxID=290746 RepID=A0A914E7Y2_9BILA